MTDPTRDEWIAARDRIAATIAEDIAANAGKGLGIFAAGRLTEAALDCPCPPRLLNGTEMITAERERQISQEHFGAIHDGQLDHETGQLALAAGVYAMPWNGGWKKSTWPWPNGFKHHPPTMEGRIRELTKAGALIAAEIDRLQRLEPAREQEARQGQDEARERWKDHPPVVRPPPDICGRVLVGRGGDTWDPACARPKGHIGLCTPTREGA
jgi:hypothetical protein